MIRVVHGENFTDFPGKSYAKTLVAYITWVNIELLDMELLGRFSKSLGYEKFGYWYYMPTEEQQGLTMSPIIDENVLGNFKMMARAHKFHEIEHLYIEHKTKPMPMNFPHYLMNSPSKRIKKLIYLLVTEDPRATVDDGIAYIKQMMNMTIPK
ncbi:unnamed protein product [Lactuca virosa]|uniref:Uncharacterized protein n=1 Tax=Lactuca virosa TaxID=75947 RepID=A0AAU9LP47_9ASTR|nr:unnamed protein product [Lactuca virosa]